ncbi:hypothetical protein OG562_40895 [Streptomyces sp. NBC_01275]|uniref:trypsin-like serine peptidase n=1 Tax=Streptomyces sp. NBC_01275 TaxID=2903807 RepID=UPI002256353C|nr:hypothetical protein [Streptomyces sp. NBC_01275]MCX4767220.1 hypothetical protein [Streptomyces sp. NBC_01275]
MRRLQGMIRALGAVALALGALGTGAGGVHADDSGSGTVRPPVAVNQAAWATGTDRQNAVIAYWTSEDMALWNANNTDYGVDGPHYSNLDEGRIWSRPGAVHQTVGRLYYRQTLAWPTTTRPSRPGDAIGTVDSTQWFHFDSTGAYVPADTTAQHIFKDSTTVTAVADGTTTTVRTVAYPTECSANVVDSANGSTVLSAGHCVANPLAVVALGSLTGAMQKGSVSATDDAWMFIPGYDGTKVGLDQAPYGLWPATAVYTTAQWNDFATLNPNTVNLSNFNYDVSALTVADPTRPGVRLADVVGSQHVAFNQPYNQTMFAFGYPNEGSWDTVSTPVPEPGQEPDTTRKISRYRYDGRSLVECNGSTWKDFILKTDYEMTCNMTGGASGGPWFQNFDPVTGIGTQVGVNSTKYPNFVSGEGVWMIAPHFEDNDQLLYNTVQNLTP